MRTFFRSIFRGEEGVGEDLADRLAEVCERHINRMLVWDATPASKEAFAASDRVDDTTGNAPRESDVEYAGAVETEAGAPWSVEHLEPSQTIELEAGSNEAEVEEPPPWEELPGVDAEGGSAEHVDVDVQIETTFDPFAFSVVVVLARNGADALHSRLEDIENARDLRELAEVQHLGVDDAITVAAELRAAIVRGAEQRLADRRAAAS